jgi:UDP-N-acetylglucosamine--N-acetylmuramyl-(pentapeptide) pyrophosphoryl-undecaprenol N-acetylglucosamine transferase
VVDVTFFCSPIGLGHAARDAAIAKQFESISTKFVTGGGAADFLTKHSFSVKNEYVPPNFSVQNGKLKNSVKWIWKYYQYYKKCKEISSQIIKEENPKLVISDEDFASLAVAQEKKISTVLITDILETRFTKGLVSLIERKMNQSMKDIMNKCDVVILPEEGNDKDNIKRVGPIVRTTNYSRDELQKKFSFNKKTILVSIGGTSAGEFLIEQTVRAVSKIKDVELVIVSGPSLKKEYEGIRNLGFVDNLHEIIFASDLVISLAGKSTIDESKAYGTPGIFIPIKDHFEQEDNAKAEGYSFDDIFRLESLILEKLEQKRTPLSCDGAKKSWKIIQDLL